MLRENKTGWLNFDIQLLFYWCAGTYRGSYTFCSLTEFGHQVIPPARAGGGGTPFSVIADGGGGGFSGYTYTLSLCNDDCDGLYTGGGYSAGAEL